MSVKSSTIWMFVFWVVQAIFIVIDNLFHSLAVSDNYNIATIFISTTLIFIWFLYDARDIKHSPSHFLRISVILIAFISIPYYLIRYKGLVRSLLSFVKFLGFVLGIAAISMLVRSLS
jgi:hypothetical protein